MKYNESWMSLWYDLLMGLLGYCLPRCDNSSSGEWDMLSGLSKRKVVTNLDSILKSRDITLPTKVYLVKAMVFPVVMYGCESWTIKKADCWRIDSFELWCWRRLLRVGAMDCNLKASILWLSAFFMVQLSHPYMTNGKTIAFTIWTFVSKVMSPFFI